MDINQFLKPFDDLFISLNKNKSVLLVIIVLLGFYFVSFNRFVTVNAIDLFDNNIFKFVVFILISYIASSSPAIGISLGIIVLVSMQIITNLKFKQEFEENIVKVEKEKFSQLQPSQPLQPLQPLQPVDMTYLSDEYLLNPLEKMNELSPVINSDDLDLKLITPNDMYMQMVKKGKVLLDDSFELENELDKRYDVREQQIAYITKRNGNELVQSGLNRLQKADDGEYANQFQIPNSNKKTKKFIKYSKLMEKNNSSSVVAVYNELIYNYDLLINKQFNEKQFNEQLEKVYLNELELLETIYKLKKNNFDENKKKQIDSLIDKIKQSKNNNNNYIKYLKELYLLII